MKYFPSLVAYLSRWALRRHSIRTQLIAWNIFALALLLAGLGLVIHYTVQKAMLDAVDHQLDQRVHAFADHPPPPHDHGPPPQNGLESEFASQFPGERGGNEEDRGGHEMDDPLRPHRPPHPGQDRNPDRPYHFNLDGDSIDPGTRRRAWDIAGIASAKRGEQTHTTVIVDGEPLRVLSAPFPPHGRIQGVTQTTYSLTELYLALDSLNRALLTLVPVALLCAGIGGVTLTDRVLRRVRRMTQAAEKISAQTFSERLPVAGNDEFSELADTFNGLLGRLEGAFHQQERLLEQQRRFTADASHELKTPLTIIKGNTSLTLSGHPTEETCLQSLREIDRSADTMLRLVQDLLLLARSDGGQLGKSPIELLVREVLERAITHGAHRQGIRIDLHVEDESLCILGNETELVRLFSNLLENAKRATPPEGRITVTACGQGDQLHITVADTGVGIPPEHLAHLGERFYRVDSSRSRPTGGTGLGLSICKSIVEAHRGTMRFESVVGLGTKVILTFPRVENSPESGK